MSKSRKITEDYIAGFVDGEGCFSLALRLDKGKYYYWKASFIISLREDDAEILNKIKIFFGHGNVLRSNCRGQVRYQICDTAILASIIVPFFKKYSLIGKKGQDFDLWKEAVLIIQRNCQNTVNAKKGIRGFVENKWDRNDLKRLLRIRDKMKIYKSGKSTRSFRYSN